MKKHILSIFLSFVLVFTLIPCNMVFATSDAQADAEMEEIFEDMGIWFFCTNQDVSFSEKETINPEYAYWYLGWSGKLDPYFDDNTWKYEMTLAQYHGLMKANFANYNESQGLAWLNNNGLYDAATKHVSIWRFELGGGLGLFGMKPLTVEQSGSTYTIKGLYLEGNEDTEDVTSASKEYYDYWWYTHKGDYPYTEKMAIDKSYEVVVKDTDDGFKIASLEVKPTYTYNGVTYYQNSKTGSFDQNFTFSIAKDTLTYTGKALTKPAVTVKNKEGNVLKAGTDYTVTWKNSTVKEVGKYTATVKLKAPYEGSKTFTVYVLPKAPSKVTVKLAKYNSVKVSWSKSTGASGYNVYYKKGNGAWSKKPATKTGTSATISDLSAGAKYTFKVVPYVTVDKKKYEGKAKSSDAISTLKKATWSSVKKYNNSKVTLKWNAVSSASGYEIYRCKTANGKYTYVDETTKTSKTIKATKGTKYFYKIKAYKVVDKKRVYAPMSAYQEYRLK